MRRVSAFLQRHLPMILGAFTLLAVVGVVWIFSAPIASWLRSAQSFDAVAFLREYLLAIGIVGACLLVVALICLPKWQAARVQDVKDRVTIENAARQTLAQIVGGVVLIAGLFFTWANLRITQETATTSQATATKNLELTREGQITDRFTAVSAADCEIPAFLATGKTYHIGAGEGAGEVKVVEVDRQTCWIKTADGAGGVYWINLKQVFSIGEVRKPPTPAPSDQRRSGEVRKPPTPAPSDQRRSGKVRKPPTPAHPSQRR